MALPSEMAALLRRLVLDAGLAERRPSLRSRLRPFLARADPEGADLLEVCMCMFLCVSGCAPPLIC